MINCLKCPRIRKQPGLIYCPFLGQQPCLHGYHEADEIKSQVNKIKPKPKLSIPLFRPAKKKCEIDWQLYHERIFRMFLIGGKSILGISKKVGLKPGAIRHYLKRYGYF